MKKFIIMALMLVGTTFAASAQEQAKEPEKVSYETIYAKDITDGTEIIRARWFIDRAGKRITSHDPEEPHVKENPQDYPWYKITSIKKEGNKETFQITDGAQHANELTVVLIIDRKLTSKDNLSGQTSTVTAKHTDSKEVHQIMTYDQLPDEEKQNIEATRKWREQEAARKAGKPTANSGAGAPKAEEPKTPQDKAKDGVKNLLNKGKDIFKKK